MGIRGYSSHLHIFTYSHLHIFTSSNLPHINIFASSHLHILKPVVIGPQVSSYDLILKHIYKWPSLDHPAIFFVFSIILFSANWRKGWQFSDSWPNFVKLQINSYFARFFDEGYVMIFAHIFLPPSKFTHIFFCLWAWGFPVFFFSKLGFFFRFGARGGPLPATEAVSSA